MKNTIFIAISILFSLQLISCKTDITETDIYVLGTAHSNHLVADFEYTLSDIQNVIKTVKPDVICIEMTAEALNKDIEGYFPPENAAIIEYAKKNNIKVIPVDWRHNLTESLKPYNISDDDKNKLKTARTSVDQLALKHLKENDWKNYFDFIQNNPEFHTAIKKQHNLKIEMLGEEHDGYWNTRNEKIVENLIKSIKDNKPKVVLVTFGLHHKYSFKELLKSKHNIDIKKVPNYTKSDNREMSEEVISRWQRNQDNLKKLLDSDAPKALKSKIKKSGRVRKLDGFIKSKGVSSIKIRHMFK